MKTEQSKELIKWLESATPEDLERLDKEIDKLKNDWIRGLIL